MSTGPGSTRSFYLQPDLPVDLLTTSAMGQADDYTIAAGTPGFTLMRRAGRAVANAVGRIAGPPAAVEVLCGPGNNGGDGLIAASLLARWGYNVQVRMLGDPAKVKGDALLALQEWRGPVVSLFDTSQWPVGSGPHVVVDALFGAGLSRPLSRECAGLLQQFRHNGARIVAVDVPSGLDGTTGEARVDRPGVVTRADVTVTFFRLKPGHCLLPGRELCGRIDLADIGIDGSALLAIPPCLLTINRPAAFGIGPPMAGLHHHKYSRGHVVVLTGAMPGAARLAATAARRMSAGYVTLVGDGTPGVFPEPGLVLQLGGAGWREIIRRAGQRPQRVAAVIGPGAGVSERLRRRIFSWVETGAPVVLDADALTVLSHSGEGPDSDIARLAAREAPQSPLVITPHDGEFVRLFPSLATASGDRVARARKAAAMINGVVVLKGADTVIAAPDGRAMINVDGPPDLATAGTGDTLAGMTAALLASGLPAFSAAGMGVYIHSMAARRAGTALVAEDLAFQIGGVLDDWPRPSRLEPHFGLLERGKLCY